MHRFLNKCRKIIDLLEDTVKDVLADEVRSDLKLEIEISHPLSSIISGIIWEVHHNIKQKPKFIITCTTCSPLITCPKMISFSLRSGIGAVVMKISNPLFLGFPLGVPTKKASCFKLIAQITTIRYTWNWRTARYQPSTMN